MNHHVLHFERTASGSFRQLRNKDLNSRRNNSAELTDVEKLISNLKKEWQNKRIDTTSLDKVQGVISTLNTAQAKNFITKAVSYLHKFVQNGSAKGVIAKMTNNDFNKLFTNLTSNENASELLNSMLSNPKMKKEAMNMMKEMLNDEKKFEQMTDIMSNMLNSKEDSE